MEAFPFASEIVEAMKKLWNTPEERRADDPAYEAAIIMWSTLDRAMTENFPLPGFLEEFQKNPERMGGELENQLKRMMWSDSNLAVMLQKELEDYKAKAITGASVNITRGDATLVGPNAQVKQETSIEVDNIDISKYLKP
jgi:hypothetical protein